MAAKWFNSLDTNSSSQALLFANFFPYFFLKLLKIWVQVTNLKKYAENLYVLNFFTCTVFNKVFLIKQYSVYVNVRLCYYELSSDSIFKILLNSKMKCVIKHGDLIDYRTFICPRKKKRIFWSRAANSNFRPCCSTHLDF